MNKLNNPKPATLHLNLRRGYFAQIAAGTKRTEYREGKPYWRRRLEGRHYDVIQFRNGYATKAPEMLVEFRGLRRSGKGRNADYAIRLGRILRVKRWHGRVFNRTLALTLALSPGERGALVHGSDFFGGLCAMRLLWAGGTKKN